MTSPRHPSPSPLTLTHQVGAAVEAVVEGIRSGEYLILSLPAHGSLIAFAAATDFNLARPADVLRQFAVGQRLSATVAGLPGGDAPGGRLLCHVALTNAKAERRPQDSAERKADGEKR